MFYNRRGHKKSPSVLKGIQMDNNLVVGRIESLGDNRDNTLITVFKEKQSFSLWLKNYKKNIEKLLEETKNQDTKMFLTAQLITCNTIESEYNRLI